jgi:hypothetical protein
MELNEYQFDGVAPKKWLTDEEYHKRFTEERDAKNDYTDEDIAAHKQHESQWKLIMPLRTQAKAFFKGDTSSVNKGMEIFKDYNPTEEQITDLLKFSRNVDGDEIIKRMDTHFGTKS